MEVLSGAPAGDDSGEQCRGDVAEGGVVVFPASTMSRWFVLLATDLDAATVC
ncbi:MAG TPA: hypothetical protein VNB91_06310 [Jatrophihabitantaceae bacterium]|nr:hypothetical protein [Jatrophihabitantaceae bacterium]